MNTEARRRDRERTDLHDDLLSDSSSFFESRDV